MGDKVWAVLIKDHFLLHDYNRLKGRKIDPLKVLHINLNAYRLRLYDGLRTSHVFNVKHLVPFVDDSDKSNSWTNLFQLEENDGA